MFYTLTGIMVQMRTRVAHLSILSRRFAAVLKRVDVDTFLSMGRLYPELSPLERRVDMHLDLIRRDEFREAECVMDLDRLLSQFEHIAETYFSGFTGDIGERGLDLAQSLDCDLDMFAAATGLTKSALQNLAKKDPGTFHVY
jgi:dynactin 1